MTRGACFVLVDSLRYMKETGRLQVEEAPKLFFLAVFQPFAQRLFVDLILNESKDEIVFLFHRNGTLLGGENEIC